MKNYSCAKLITLGLVSIYLSACQNIPNTPSTEFASKENRIAELQIVDCLLPGQVRMLGGQTYMTPRRPTRTTASECQILGGEYVAYDRADYKTALAVWMPQAEAGNAEAQATVGEIFERGLGGTANYEAAKIWYEKAATQGNKKAQFNLGTFYEQGLGVPKDMVVALNWYRKAWGMPSDEIMYQSTLKVELEKQKKALNKSLRKKNLQIKLLEREMDTLRSEANSAEAAKGELSAELEEMSSLVADLKSERNEVQQNAEKVENKIRLRQPITPALSKPRQFEFSVGHDTKESEFGRYYALVIGNQQYQHMDDLVTPVSDTEKVSQLLETKYGFEVIRLNNSDNIAIMDAINNLNNVLGENDNLLIYYAGHGNRVKTGDFESGYWLPVNADAPPRDTLWVSNEFITRHIARFAAKRIMVIADSCYAGLLSNSPDYLMINNSGGVSAKYIEYKKPRRSRILLASGGDKPVLDNGGGDNSVFARALLDVLESNDRLLTGPEMFSSIKQQVVKDSKAQNFQQIPEYKAIKGAGHEMGDFFFIPNRLAQK